MKPTLCCPTVRPLMERILENIRRLKNKSETVISPRAARSSSHGLDGPIARRRRNCSARVGSQRWGRQIHSYGCICKGVEQGLIDFPCVLGAEVVFLAGNWVNRPSAIGTGSKMVLPGAGLCSTAGKRALMKKPLTINSRQFGSVSLHLRVPAIISVDRFLSRLFMLRGRPRHRVDQGMTRRTNAQRRTAS